jgi:acetyl-CoA acyltransferase
MVDVEHKTKQKRRMNEAVIVGACRSPIGKIRGALAQIRPDDLLAQVLKGLVENTGIDPGEVSEVFAGCANQAGEDNRNIARMSWLIAGYPYEVPAITVNRLCASGLDAVIQASRAIQLGEHEVVIAGGVESMTRSPYAMGKSSQGFGSGHPKIYDSALGWRFPNPQLEKIFPLEAMGETAENIAHRYNISRLEQDEFALQSHQRSLRAWANGAFKAEVLPIDIVGKKGNTRVFQDEGPRSDTTLEKLAKLRPAFRAEGSVSAGNSSTLNDGAAALLITTPERAKSWGLPILAKILGSANAGVDPRFMGLGPIPATQKLLRKLKLEPSDLDIIEINEAFAVQTLAVCRDLGLEQSKVNPKGGAIALGHPLGCSGARILTTLVHSMQADSANLGLASLCVGVGQGVSLVVERV